MSTLFGLNATKRDVDVPANKIAVEDQHGRIRTAFDQITFTAELATNDILKMMKLPEGSVLRKAKLENEAVDMSVDVGWAASVKEVSGAPVEVADPDGIIVAKDLVAAAVTKMEDVVAIPGTDKKFNAEVCVQLLVKDVSTNAVGKTLKLNLEYVVD